MVSAPDCGSGDVEFDAAPANSASTASVISEGEVATASENVAPDGVHSNERHILNGGKDGNHQRHRADILSGHRSARPEHVMG